MTAARDRARARRLAGRGAAGRRRRAGVLARSGAHPGVARALPVGFARHHRPRGHDRRLDADAPGPAGCSGSPPATRARSRASCARSPGAATGVLLAQQTAANLHAQPGDTDRDRPRRAAAGAACASTASSTCPRPTRCSSASAPRRARSPRRRPTTSCCCPQRRTVRRAVARARAELVRTQVHAASPRAARQPERGVHAGLGQARNLETRLAGAGLVGDNLGAALDQARQDALYAQLLFLFLGLPGAILAGLVTASIAAAGADRRRRDAALLRTRGATTRQLVRLALAEAALAGGVGRRARPGRRAADRRGRVRHARASAPARSPRCCGRAAPRSPGCRRRGAIALPAWRDARALTVAGQRRQSAAATRAPWWARYGLDFVALAGAGARVLAGVAQRLQARARARGRPAGLGQLVRAAGARAGVDRRRAARLPARRPRAAPRPARRWRARCARSPASSSPTVAATMGRQRRCWPAPSRWSR